MKGIDRNMSTVVSIIMPVYNAGKYLSTTLESVKNQTFQDYELIVVNDGSTDDSLEILYENKKKIPQLRIINQENSGVSATRNKGIQEAKGAYICFLDADDYLHPQFLEVLYEQTKKCLADIVVCDYVPFYGTCVFSALEKTCSYKVLDGLYGQKIFDYMMDMGIGTSMCNKMIRKSLLVDNHILLNPQTSYGEDMFFCWKAVLVAQNIIYIQEKLYGYRMNDEGTSVKYHPQLLEKYENEYRELICFGQEHGMDMQILEESIQLNLVHRLSSFFRMNIRRKSSCFQKYDYIKKLREKQSIDYALATWDMKEKEKISGKEKKLLEAFRKKNYVHVLLKTTCNELRIQLGRKIKARIK